MTAREWKVGERCWVAMLGNDVPVRVVGATITYFYDSTRDAPPEFSLRTDAGVAQCRVPSKMYANRHAAELAGWRDWRSFHVREKRRNEASVRRSDRNIDKAKKKLAALKARRK